MNVTYQALAQGAMLYDGSRLDQMQPEQFEMDYWQSQPNPPELATGGRGTVVFIGGDQFSWALRHYRRGGLPGRVLSDQFLFLGENPTRSFREFRLLAMLYDMGLPVPRPVAARYVRSGAIYRADLITARIPEARPLSSLLDSAELGNEVWANTGKLIRRFHEARESFQPHVTIWGTGTPRREFLHVDDMADAALFVLDLPAATYAANTAPMLSHINVGTGEDISILDLAHLVAGITGFEGNIATDPSRPDGTPRKLMDSTRLLSKGWKPQVEMREGIARAYEDFKKRYL